MNNVIRNANKMAIKDIWREEIAAMIENVTQRKSSRVRKENNHNRCLSRPHRDPSTRSNNR